VNRAVIAFVLLLTLLWQSAGLAHAASTADAAAGLGHAALHWQEEGHHHHDDGSYHVEDSADSVQHLLADQVGASVGLLVERKTAFPAGASSRPGTEHPAASPHPDPDGLFRPPRVSA
jgi:hypothetical protein